MIILYSVSEELKDKVKELNSTIKNKYKDVLSIDKKTLRNFIEDNIGEILKLDRLSTEELEKFLGKGGILGVDGSMNKMGGAYPHFVEVYQGLAKSSLYSDQPIYKADFYTPLNLEREKATLNELEGKADKGGKNDAITDYKLSGIEVDAALEGLNDFDPYAIMMDGSLIRYDIECYNKWIQLRKECERKGVILIGVIKDIKTSVIGQGLLEERRFGINDCFHDRELLYGLLEYGEMICIKDDVGKKSREGFSSIFMRSSNSPSVIGMDILDSQKEHLGEMARLVFSLTPFNSRGVPLWLDIVDSEVKISDKMVQNLLERYLDRDVLEKFFISERDKRTL